MKWLKRYNESTTIKATNSTIKKMVRDEIEKLGTNAHLNHIDVSGVTNMSKLFIESAFSGDISKWNVENVENMMEMFWESRFNGDISKWNVENMEGIEQLK